MDTKRSKRFSKRPIRAADESSVARDRIDAQRLARFAKAAERSQSSVTPAPHGQAETRLGAFEHRRGRA
jgi:hypothetical protein